MSVARNWVALGSYGRLLDGQPAARGLEAAFPVTATVALSFRLFGIGVIQARLVAVIFTLAALALLYELARRFYNRSIAIAALLVLIFMSGQAEINPLIAGRQVLAEIPALCFLLAGYLCFVLAEKHFILFMPAAVCRSHSSQKLRCDRFGPQPCCYR
jgi:Dolichyl-phosphate-mannose-protein mannosyltransferase